MVRERSRGGGGGGGMPDRLSALPDCLLHTIMSFLKARQAVQTSVLSTRWRHLWRSVLCLDIDLDEFTAAPDPDGNDLPPDPDGNDYESSSSSSSDDDDNHGAAFKNKEWECFEDFAMNLMLRCNIAQLESFRLHIERRRTPSSGDRQAAAWLRSAMKYCRSDRNPHRQGLSSCSWLLKRLHLCHVRLDDCFVKRVNSVCHSLEDMKLEDCTCEIQSITSDSLKTLILKNCRGRNLREIASPILKTLVIDGGYNRYKYLLVILAPAVTCLHLASNISGGISLNEMPSLAKASITKIYGDQFKLLCSASNVTSLELSDLGTEVLGMNPTFQEFKNLRNLVLGNCDLTDNFRTLGFFLQSSPNLEKLTLRHCQFPRNYAQKKGTPQLNQALSSEFHGLDFMCENLKVEIIHRKGNARLASQLVNLLLRAAGNLSKSNIKLTKVE